MGRLIKYITPYERFILRQLQTWGDWWYGMGEFSLVIGTTEFSARISLDILCRKRKVEKLIDKEGEGYYLAQADR